MALNKQPIAINFAKGLDTKTDPNQVAVGNFLTLQNSVFTKAGLLQKRNGFVALTSLPSDNNIKLTTFNGGLTAIGTELFDFSSGSDTWIDKGALQPVSLSVLPTVRMPINQTQADSATASNGLACVVFTSVNNGTPSYSYSVLNSVTGQILIVPTLIPVASGTVAGSPRIFLLGRHFVIVVTVLISGVYHLQYLTINTNDPTMVSSTVNISSQYTPNSSVAFDGYVANNSLYLAWNGNDGGGAIHMVRLTSTLVLSSIKTFTGYTATMMSVTADNTINNPVIYVSFYDSGSSNGFVLIVDSSLGTVLAPTSIITGTPVSNITVSAQNGSASILYEVINAYGYDSSIPTNLIDNVNVTESGTVSSTITLIRSVGLASKAFIVNAISYFLVAYQSVFQPSYFLIDGSGQVVAKLAYSNGGGYITTGLPNVTIDGTIVSTTYLFKDLIEAVNKAQGVPNAAGVYSQTGINIVTFNLAEITTSTSEIAGGLNLSGGFLWHYDGVQPVENNFFVWPDDVEATAQTAAGSMTVQQYFYVATYEWMDAAGNIERSAPSIPFSITLSGGENQVTVDVPTLRLTYKISNAVKIVLYRWSVAQQVYYQVTSVNAPLLNDTTVDYVTFVDTQADTSILGNSILYTTGGVIEDISPPSTFDMCLYKSRLFLIDSEDQNLMWYSKQVIENTPVEMSDLFTIYVAPTIGSQGNTGPLRVLSAMDDKLIMFKDNAIYYLTGTGPDNTGANNDFSDPIFITSTVGSSNSNSIVFTPIGLMFQSDKGIWLLGRDLSTNYIGAPVEAFNGATVLASLAIPGTNQVRFTLDNGVTLMYDYYYNQWGTFINIPAISSTLYNGLHTYINKFGQVLQESPGLYLDGSNPVLLSFTTGWLNLAGLQGYERAYYVYLLATYVTPHKITVQIAYDYNPSPTQSSVITPTNFSGVFGSDTVYGGGSPYGGQATVEQWRVFLQQQKCQAFQLTVNESFDPSLGTTAGAGFTMSGMNAVVGIKSGYPRIKPSQSVG